MLHDHVVLLTIQAADVPTVADEDRLHIEHLPSGFYRRLAWYGYMETPNVPKAMRCPLNAPSGLTLGGRPDRLRALGTCCDYG
jgi:K+ transporter